MLTLAKFFLKEINIPLHANLAAVFIVRVWGPIRNELTWMY